MPDFPQESVSRRIRALLMKTVENGATESEALAAATKARALMDQYRLNMTDVQIEDEPVVKDEFYRPNAVRYAAVDYCKPGIEQYCGVRMWMHRTFENGRQVTKRAVIGLKADVEMARYLYEMIAAAIRVELTAHRKEVIHWTRDETSSFQVGMASRINSRLIDVAKELEPVAKTASGTALVVVKGAIVENAYNKLGLSSIRYGGLGGGQSSSAYLAGQNAGDRVNLSRPIANNDHRSIGN